MASQVVVQSPPNSHRPSAPAVEPASTAVHSAPANPQFARLGILLILGFLATVLFGKFTLLDSVKTADQAMFDSSVGFLQSIPGVTRLSVRFTDLGAVQLNYGMALVLAVTVSIQRRSWYLGELVLLAMFGCHLVQKLTHQFVDGYAPTSQVIGDAGPYFSGGVARVILLTGMIATLARPRGLDRWVWHLAIVLGLFEAVTRLALGRHWPLDLVAAFPIGLALVYVFREAARYEPNQSTAVLTRRDTSNRQARHPVGPQ